MLDMDEPHEVVAAARGFTDALTEVGGRVEAVTREFVAPRPPRSPMEIPLAAYTDWMREAFPKALRANARRAGATARHTEVTVTALGHQDDAGGARIRRTESL